MSSDEDTLEDGNAAEHTEAKERTDRLMSMAEYHDEIYEYLRKSEVCLCLKNLFIGQLIGKYNYLEFWTWKCM